MSPEVLQQLIQLAGSAGDGAMTLAILLIAKGYFIAILTGSLIAGVAVGGYKLIRSFNEDRLLLQSICALFPEAGVDRYDGYRSERSRLLGAIKESRV